jgi:uncharacterized protein (DUF3084 family)
MAKALVGYMNASDPRTVSRLSAENRRLRERVADLEAHVLRLQRQNDALVAERDAELLAMSEQMSEQMQPV